jgi:hypothetical protein
MRTDANPRPVLDHLDVLRHDAGLLTNILHGIAAAGAENATLAKAAIGVWPGLLAHALTYADGKPSVYRERTWGSWAAGALLPDPLPWTQGLYNELSGPPIDWVDPTQLTDLVDRWLPVGSGEALCRRADPARTQAASPGASDPRARLGCRSVCSRRPRHGQPIGVVQRLADGDPRSSRGVRHASTVAGIGRRSRGRRELRPRRVQHLAAAEAIPPARADGPVAALNGRVATADAATDGSARP